MAAETIEAEDSLAAPSAPPRATRRKPHVTSGGDSGPARAPRKTPRIAETASPAVAAGGAVGAVAASTKVEKTPRSSYQNIILAEFVATILLTALTPIAKKKSADTLSPYRGQDIVKLGAITILFMILAFMSSSGPKAGRLAAWFGGLILIVDGMAEAANIAKDLAIFTGGIASAAGDTGTPPAPLNPATLPLGSTGGSLFPTVGPSGGTTTPGPAQQFTPPAVGPRPGPNPEGG